MKHASRRRVQSPRGERAGWRDTTTHTNTHATTAHTQQPHAHKGTHTQQPHTHTRPCRQTHTMTAHTRTTATHTQNDSTHKQRPYTHTTTAHTHNDHTHTTAHTHTHTMTAETHNNRTHARRQHTQTTTAHKQRPHTHNDRTHKRWPHTQTMTAHAHNDRTHTQRPHTHTTILHAHKHDRHRQSCRLKAALGSNKCIWGTLKRNDQGSMDTIMWFSFCLIFYPHSTSKERQIDPSPAKLLLCSGGTFVLKSIFNPMLKYFLCAFLFFLGEKMYLDWLWLVHLIYVLRYLFFTESREISPQPCHSDTKLF